jgi:Ferredoxin subunits of nitrite reductase and ring-hydroxylating dioxygenases
MKKIIALLFISIAIAACSDSNFNNRNPYIPNYSFSVEINTNLPLYSDLQYTGNGKLITLNGAGANGIIVFNAGSGNFRAYDASCPNQYPSSCSRLEVEGINAVCPCDDVAYSLFTGLADADVEYPMKPYRVEVNGNVIRVYN